MIWSGLRRSLQPSIYNTSIDLEEKKVKKEYPANLNLFASPDIDLGADIMDAETVNLYLHRTTAVGLMAEMTVDQMVRTIDDLAFLTTQLTAKLVDAIKNHEINTQHNTVDEVALPSRLLKLAEIPDSATLDVEISKGAIHITMSEDEDDEESGFEDDLPLPIRSYLAGCGISETALRNALRSDIRIRV